MKKVIQFSVPTWIVIAVPLTIALILAVIGLNMFLPSRDTLPAPYLVNVYIGSGCPGESRRALVLSDDVLNDTFDEVQKHFVGCRSVKERRYYEGVATAALDYCWSPIRKPGPQPKNLDEAIANFAKSQNLPAETGPYPARRDKSAKGALDCDNWYDAFAAATEE